MVRTCPPQPIFASRPLQNWSVQRNQDLPQSIHCQPVRRKTAMTLISKGKAHGSSWYLLTRLKLGCTVVPVRYLLLYQTQSISTLWKVNWSQLRIHDGSKCYKYWLKLAIYMIIYTYIIYIYSIYIYISVNRVTPWNATPDHRQLQHSQRSSSLDPEHQNKRCAWGDDETSCWVHVG